MFPNINKILLLERFKEIYKVKGEIEYNIELCADNKIKFFIMDDKLKTNYYNKSNNILLKNYVKTIDCEIEKYIDCAGFEIFCVFLTEKNRDILKYKSIVKKSEYKSLIFVGFDSCRELYDDTLYNIKNMSFINFKVNENNIYKIINDYLIEDDICIIINDEYLNRELNYIQFLDFLNFVSNEKYKHNNLFIKMKGIVYPFKK